MHVTIPRSNFLLDNLPPTGEIHSDLIAPDSDSTVMQNLPCATQLKLKSVLVLKFICFRSKAEVMDY